MNDDGDTVSHIETITLLAEPLAHLDDLVALRVRWANEDGRHISAGDPFLDDFRSWLSNQQQHRRFWIATVNNAPVAMVNLLVFDRMPTPGKASGGWGYLCNMYVDPAHRNGGLGARLASAVLAHGDQARLERIVLSPSERSRPFYASLGFEAASNLLLRPRSASQQ